MRLALFAIAPLALVACSSADTTPSTDPTPSNSTSSSSGGSVVPPYETTKTAPSVTDQRGPFFRAAADRGALAAFTLDQAALGTDGALRIANGAGHHGVDPQPTGYHGGSFYNGGSYRYAVATSPVFVSRQPFDSITPSFEASAPEGTWLHVKLTARVNGQWTKEYSLGVWTETDGLVRRHSVEGQADTNGDVETDTLELTKTADAFRIIVVMFSATTASPTVRAVSAVATARSSATTTSSQAGDPRAFGKGLQVPKLSQMIYNSGGEGWCSPTSTSMLLNYWADVLGAHTLRETPPEAAVATRDYVYDGTGNWPFNTAYAASMDGGTRLHGAVTRLSSFSQVEQLIAAEVPVAISIRYGKGELSGSPISSTNGHLVVVRGIATNGDIVCNDPAFRTDASVEVTYNRAELTRAWQRSLGTTYLVWPTSRSLPVDPAGAFF